MLVKETRILPEEDIFKIGEESNKIFIIIKGHVENVRYIINNNGINKPLRLSTLKVFKSFKNNLLKFYKFLLKQEGDIFGEIGFFSDRTRNSTMRSINVTNLAYIEKKEFMDLIKGFPLDYESLMMMNHNINVYYNNHGLSTQ